MDSIGLFPSSSYVSVGNLGLKIVISAFTTSASQEALVLLLFVRPDDCPLTIDLFFFLCGVRRVENSLVYAKGSSSSIIVPLILEQDSMSMNSGFISQKYPIFATLSSSIVAL